MGTLESRQVAAHETGHAYGLDLPCEEYADCNSSSRKDNIGNYADAGLWVEKRIPLQVTSGRDIYCFMGSTGSHETWIDSADYLKLLNDSKAGAAPGSVPAPTATRSVLAIGTVSVTGGVSLDNWYVLSEGEFEAPLPGPYTFEYRNAVDAVLSEQSFDISFDREGSPLTQAPFVFTIPYVTETAKIVIKQSGVQKAEKSVSTNSPTVLVLSPNGGEQLYGQTTIQWTGSDDDDNSLSYAVLFSNDNGDNWQTIAANLGTTSYQWNVAGLTAGNRYLIKVIATDGFNTGQDVSDSPLSVVTRVFLPIVIKQ
ncbi:MAG: fibronectin type III domain-containing protein [Dehalococcoidia bacterium]|nr:fibronectin type III domain-containing protein [Dehalococcoidia bacterium]